MAVLNQTTMDRFVELGRRGINTLLTGNHGIGKCVDAEDRLRLKTGELIPAADLVGETFQVFSVDDNLRLASSVAVAFDNGIKDVVRIETDRGRVIRRTLNHPLWASIQPRQSGRLRPEGAWVPAGDLSVDSCIAVFLGGIPTVPHDVSDEGIVLCAYLLAEGGLSGNNLRFSQMDGFVLQEMRSVCDVFGVLLKPVGGVDYDLFSGGRKCGRGGSDFRALLRSWGLLGKNSYTKSFPAWVWLLDYRQLSLFLNRLLACDGHAYGGLAKNGRTLIEVGYTSVSENLAKDVALATLRLGIHTEIRKKRTTWIHNGVRHRGLAWVVSCHDAVNVKKFLVGGIYGKDDAVRFVRELADLKSFKQQQRWRSHSLSDNFRWERVKFVEYLPARQTVGVSAPGDETFLTDFVEHNTTMFVDLCERLGMTGAYINVPSCDYFVDWLGIPAPDEEPEHIRTIRWFMQRGGESLAASYAQASMGLDAITATQTVQFVHSQVEQHNLNFLRPKRLNGVNFIFFDEINREADPRFVDSCMELVQFRTINGQPVPSLKLVWAAQNPPGTIYKVKPLDIPLIDKFGAHIAVEGKPDYDWYVSKGYDPHTVASVISWFDSDLNNDQKKLISPRCIENLIRLVDAGIDPNFGLLEMMQVPSHMLTAKLARCSTSHRFASLDLPTIAAQPLPHIECAKSDIDFCAFYSDLIRQVVIRPVAVLKTIPVFMAMPYEFQSKCLTDADWVLRMTQATNNAAGLPADVTTVPGFHNFVEMLRQFQ